jgi:hypothetical protein
VATRTAGSASGLEKRPIGNVGTALQADSANLKAARRSDHDHRREHPSSKNSTTMAPKPSTNSSDTDRCHARDVTTS